MMTCVNYLLTTTSILMTPLSRLTSLPPRNPSIEIYHHLLLAIQLSSQTITREKKVPKVMLHIALEVSLFLKIDTAQFINVLIIIYPSRQGVRKHTNDTHRQIGLQYTTSKSHAIYSKHIIVIDALTINAYTYHKRSNSRFSHLTPVPHWTIVS